MKIALIAIGKTADKNIAAGIEKYLGRVGHYLGCDFITLPDSKTSGDIPRQRETEGKAILGAITPGDRVVLLDERGQSLTSRQFAQSIQKTMSAGVKRLVFVIGGAYGFSPEVYARADARLSLSAMTFPHDLVRLLFAEQLYRALTILNNEKYHHD